jgi:hypothetical protein
VDPPEIEGRKFFPELDFATLDLSFPLYLNGGHASKIEDFGFPICTTPRLELDADAGADVYSVAPPKSGRSVLFGSQGPGLLNR